MNRKKFLDLLIVAVMIACVSFGCVGCNSSDITGTYYVSRICFRDESYDVGDKLPSGEVLTKDYLVIEIVDENTFYYSYSTGNTFKKTRSTLYKEGDEYNARILGGTSKFYFSGNTLTMPSWEDSDLIFILKK